MNSPIAISIRDLSKKYRLFDSARDRLKEALHPFAKRFHREFWALRNINLEIPRGQTVGILGRNGSGKSTLLQLVGAIMQPTSGVVEVSGRVSALLELGAGFNPEFTGRENVMFQAQVMGMTRSEIEIRLPAIEAFADIGEFFDQPVKIYSSGMFVRVAFAIAISVDPDILIIDEALAVGDVAFQEKCYARLREFKEAGNTILFVSHSAATVTALCDRAVILEDHRIYADGNPKEIVDKYLRLVLSNQFRQDALTEAASELPSSPNVDARASGGDQCRVRPSYNPEEVRGGAGGAAIVDYILNAKSRERVNTFKSGERLELFIRVEYSRRVIAPIIGLMLKTVSGIQVFGTNSFMNNAILKDAFAGESRWYKFSFALALNGGDYFIDLGVAEADGSPGGMVIDVRRSMIHITVSGPSMYRFSGIADLSATVAEIGDVERNVEAVEASFNK